VFYRGAAIDFLALDAEPRRLQLSEWRSAMRTQCPTVAALRVSRRRRAAAALEFAIVCPLLFLIFLGMIEIGRAMMVAGSVANAARVGARSAAVTGGGYDSAVAAASRVLSDAGLPSSGALVVTVTVNDVVVKDEASFTEAAVPGATITVKVALPYASVSWLPGGGALFLSSNQLITAANTMAKEG
jgi:Flp pilus assembly protein TadG